MSLQKSFTPSTKSNIMNKVDDHQLEVKVGGYHGPTVYTTYDFLARVMYTTVSSSGASVAVTPFAQMDRESVEFMHAALKKLGGKPPELPTVVEEDKGLVKTSPPKKSIGLG